MSVTLQIASRNCRGQYELAFLGKAILFLFFPTEVGSKVEIPSTGVLNIKVSFSRKPERGQEKGTC